MRSVGQFLVTQHVDHLLGAAQTFCVCFLGRYAHRFVRSLYDNLGSLGQSCDGGTPGDYGECLCFVLWEAAHPLVQNGSNFYVSVAVLVQIFFRQGCQGTDSRYVLDQVTALAVTYSYVLYALFSSQQRFDDGYGVGDTRWNQSTGQRTIWFTVDAYACFFIDTGQTVAVLPVTDGLFQLNILCVRNVVGDTAAFVGSKTTSVGDFGQQSCIRCTVTDLNWSVQFIDDVAACVYTVVYNRQTVQHGLGFTDGFLNTNFSFLISVLSGVRVDGGWQQVCFTLVLQVSQQVDVVLYQSNTGTRLYQSLAFVLCLDQLLTEVLVFWQALVEFYCFVEVNSSAGRPLSQNFFLQAVKFVICQSFILQFHRILTPFS